MAADELAQRRDINALYTGHHDWLQRWLSRQTGCSEMAADLAQETFLRVIHKQQKDQCFSISYPRRYLRMAANSLMIDLFRRRAVEQAYQEALAQRADTCTLPLEEREIILETLQRLDRLLGQLPGPVRQAFLLSRLEGLTYAEIGDQLKVSERTVKRYMQQAFVLCLDLMV
ncbi:MULTISPECIES: sigma-70 family RNA polymerase sigma factor [Marinobacter]|uniref:sigma-70 family RNA polymerase sigma factor n=1 Tax=Marinobacter TaxID=2742 RepID=UPI001D069575|nr:MULTISPECIES: sigma-70 family RNA polymerase sigma factor [Marinobacter]MCG8518103.1 sigma-70 family RNA polymerase sigma factor [Pseudomonadales bacterium]MCK7565617.1 sigma-70 family RNA polymerase sigma factor [Marinobacter xestospongiae]UDL06239.1 sigma-70 family RNA polymerase sigma factor [Marinobacter sp. CA1]